MIAITENDMNTYLSLLESQIYIMYEEYKKSPTMKDYYTDRQKFYFNTWEHYAKLYWDGFYKTKIIEFKHLLLF